MIIFGQCSCEAYGPVHKPYHTILSNGPTVGAYPDFKISEAVTDRFNFNPATTYNVDVSVGFPATNEKQFFIAGFNVVMGVETGLDPDKLGWIGSQPGSQVTGGPLDANVVSGVPPQLSEAHSDMPPGYAANRDLVASSLRTSHFPVSPDDPVYSSAISGLFYYAFRRSDLSLGVFHGQEFLMSPKFRSVMAYPPCLPGWGTTLVFRSYAPKEDAFFFSAYPEVHFGGAALIEVYYDPNNEIFG